MLVLTIICAMTSFVLELFYVLETFKIVRKLKNMFQKQKGEDPTKQAAENHLEKIQKFHTMNMDKNFGPVRRSSTASQANLVRQIDKHH